MIKAPVQLTSDEAKALLQLVSIFPAYPMATGLSHLMGLVIQDAMKWRDKVQCT